MIEEAVTDRAPQRILFEKSIAGNRVKRERETDTSSMNPPFHLSEERLMVSARVSRDGGKSAGRGDRYRRPDRLVRERNKIYSRERAAAVIINVEEKYPITGGSREPVRDQ